MPTSSSRNVLSHLVVTKSPVPQSPFGHSVSGSTAELKMPIIHFMLILNLRRTSGNYEEKRDINSK